MQPVCSHDWKAEPAYACDACMGEVHNCALVLARKASRNEDDAHDIASEAIVEILRVRRFDPDRGSFTTYLRVVVKNAAAAFYRASKRASRNVTSVGPLHVQVAVRNRIGFAESHDPTAEIREAELTVMLAQVLENLEPYDCQAFTLHLAGYHRDEISQQVLVDGHRLTPQRWSQRLRPIEDAVGQTLGLLKGR
jgi:RNA polymerase sigma factor (sigma-70 family)